MTSRVTRYADPERCPDCRRPIALGAPRCEACGLPLHGELASRLFQTLATADDLLTQLRASAWPAPATPAPAAPPLAVPPRSRLSAATVPQILLGLGALCVLVAALVFLAVTWSVMGVGGRTVTLVTFTALTGGLGWWLARRGLRAAAESLVLVSLGLLVLDIIGAGNAGWLGDPSTEWFLVLLGGTLALAATGFALAVRRTPVGALVGAQVATGIGVAVASFGLADVDQGTTDVDLVGAVCLGLLAGEGLRRLRLELATLLAFVVAGLHWLLLLTVGTFRVLEHPTWAELWAQAHVWPALAAAALVAGVAPVRSLPVVSRVAGLSVALAIVVGAVVAPVMVDGHPTAAVLTGLAVLVPTGLWAWSGPRPWAFVPLATQAVAGAGVGSAGLWLAAESLRRLEELSDGVAVLPLSRTTELSGWLQPLCAAAVLGTVASVYRPVLEPRLVAGLVAGSVVLTAPLYAAPVWVLAGLPVAAGLGFLAWWFARRSLVQLGLAAGFLVVGVALAEPSEVALVVTLALVLLAAAVVHLDDSGLAGDVAGAVAAVTVAALTFAVGDLVDAPAPWVALVGLLLLAAVGATGRPGLEVGAAAAAAPVALAGLTGAADDVLLTWAAVYLTVAGAAISGVALARPNRRLAGWAGGLLLVAATWVRLYDVGVTTPEAYTLPSAVALLAVGLWHLRRRESSGTVALLGPGLTLALVPSLLWSLDEPTGLRVLLLGLACLALVLAGVRLRWSAPVLWGAIVGGLLVVRLAAPYVGDSVPRWVLIGAAGALLIATGVTWERRLQEARQLREYVRRLR